MTETSYAGNAILLKPEIKPRIEKLSPVVQAVAEHRAPVKPLPGALEIRARGRHRDEKPTWNIRIVLHHGQGGFQRWFANLHDVTRLKQGWDGYTAPAPGPEAIASAELYLSTLELLRWEPSRVEASVMGGVGITHREGVRKVYVEFYNDGRVHALFSDRTPNMQTIPVGADIQSYYRFIGKAREYLNG
jgi:hypothetical protein